MKYGLDIASCWDLEFIAENMDPADVAEVWAMGRKTPLEALVASTKVSRETFVGLVDGEPICAFGIGQRTLMDNVGIPWLLGTPEIRKHPRPFLRVSKNWIERAAQDYVRLENWVDVRHTRAVKWLKWLGFTLEEPTPFGPDRMMFHRFHMGGR